MGLIILKIIQYNRVLRVRSVNSEGTAMNA